MKEAKYSFCISRLSDRFSRFSQLRSVLQDKTRLDILERLNDDTVLIFNDWATKLLPQSCTQSQKDWFTNRGISRHIAVVFPRSGEIQSQTLFHIVKSCSQSRIKVERLDLATHKVARE